MGEEVNVTASINIPKVPNFFITENGNSIPISAVEDSELRRIGSIWIENLIKRAKEQRLND